TRPPPAQTSPHSQAEWYTAPSRRGLRLLQDPSYSSERRPAAVPDQTRARFEVADAAALPLVGIAQTVRDVDNSIDQNRFISVFMAVRMHTRTEFAYLLVQSPRSRNTAEIETRARGPERGMTTTAGLRRKHQIGARQKVTERNDRRVVV